MTWGWPALMLVLLTGCDVRMPDVGGMLSSGTPPSFAELGPSIPRAPDAIAAFAATAQPGVAGTVNGESARLNRAYNAASGRECREVVLGFGGSERTAVACREADGSFVSSRPLLRGALR